RGLGGRGRGEGGRGGGEGGEDGELHHVAWIVWESYVRTYPDGGRRPRKAPGGGGALAWPRFKHQKSRGAALKPKPREIDPEHETEMNWSSVEDHRTIVPDIVTRNFTAPTTREFRKK
ncbi:hypothetical protein THAOC_07165, partial [Thalassiosira oceanica]